MSLGPIEARVAPPGLVSGEAAGPAVAVAPPKTVDPTGEPSPFAKMLHGLGNQIEGGENMMRTAVASARDRSPLELIMLQANVYRYSEAIDLASRLVDHATSGIKTIIQGGGQ